MDPGIDRRRDRRAARWAGLVVLASGTALAVGVAAAADSLGPRPPESALLQSRCGAMHFSPHVATLGQRQKITGRAGPAHPEACSGSATWSWSFYQGLTPVKGCRANGAICVLKPTAPTGRRGHRFVVGCIDGGSGFGPWVSCDYYAVLGKGCFELSGKVSTRGSPNGRVLIIASGPGGGGSAVTDPTGFYSMTLCRKGRYRVIADSKVTLRPLSYAYTTFSPVASKDCHPKGDACIVDVKGERVANFSGAVSQRQVSPCPRDFFASGASPDCPEEPAGPGLFSPPDKVSLKAAADINGAVADTILAPPLFVNAAIGAGASAGITTAKTFLTASQVVYLGAAAVGFKAAQGIDKLLAFALDPFDPNYAVVAVPHPLPVPKLRAGTRKETKAARAFIANGLKMAATARALYTTVNRLSSAQQSGDAQAEALQRGARTRYLNRLATLTDEKVRVQRQLGTLLRKAHRARIAMPRRLITRAQRVVRQIGPPVQLGRLLGSLGISTASSGSWIAQVAKAKLPRRIDVAALLTKPKLVRAERRLAAIFRAAAKRP